MTAVHRPTVHLGGTSKQALLDGYIAAGDRVREAIEAVQQTAPNGRDWFPPLIGVNTFRAAQREHEVRLGILDAVLHDLEALAQHVSEQA